MRKKRSITLFEGTDMYKLFVKEARTSLYAMACAIKGDLFHDMKNFDYFQNKLTRLKVYNVKRLIYKK